MLSDSPQRMRAAEVGKTTAPSPIVISKGLTPVHLNFSKLGAPSIKRLSSCLVIHLSSLLHIWTTAFLETNGPKAA